MPWISVIAMVAAMLVTSHAINARCPLIRTSVVAKRQLWKKAT
jgi:hypothetical protein